MDKETLPTQGSQEIPFYYEYAGYAEDVNNVKNILRDDLLDVVPGKSVFINTFRVVFNGKKGKEVLLPGDILIKRFHSDSKFTKITYDCFKKLKKQYGKL